MKRMLLTLGAMAVLAGCTPLQMCLSEVDQSLREVTRELETRRMNLRRGYAVELVTRPDFIQAICQGPNGAPVPCFQRGETTEEIRHPINPAFERERIALLERQLVQAQAQAERDRATCVATYPE